MSCPGLVVVAALGLGARSDGSVASRSTDKPHVGLGERRSAARSRQMTQKGGQSAKAPALPTSGVTRKCTTDDDCVMAIAWHFVDNAWLSSHATASVLRVGPHHVESVLRSPDSELPV